jgi:hypothetical protein
MVPILSPLLLRTDVPSTLSLQIKREVSRTEASVATAYLHKSVSEGKLAFILPVPEDSEDKRNGFVVRSK